MQCLSSKKNLSRVLECLTVYDAFANLRATCPSLKRRTERLPFLEAKVSPHEAHGFCRYLRGRAAAGAPFPISVLRTIELLGLTEECADIFAVAILRGGIDHVVALKMLCSDSVTARGLSLVFGSLNERPPLNLAALDLSGSKLGDDVIVNFVGNPLKNGTMKTLESLSLAACAMTEAAARRFAACLSSSGCQARLRYLDCSGNGLMGNEGAAALFRALAAPALSSLKYLSLAGGGLGPAPMSELCVAVRRGRGQQWHTVDFSHNAAGSGDSSGVLEALGHEQGSSSATPRGFVGLFACLGAGGCPSLVELRLANTEFGDTDAAALAKAFSALPRLAGLDLRLNRLGPAGLGALSAGLGQLPRLANLGLAHNRGGDAGVGGLSAALLSGGGRRLCYLDVGFNGASLGAIQRLAAVLAGGACPRLVEVAVEGNVPPHVHVGGALKNSGAMNARAAARRMRCK